MGGVSGFNLKRVHGGPHLKVMFNEVLREVSWADISGQNTAGREKSWGEVQR